MRAAGRIAVPLLVVGALAVIVVSFFSQQNERLETVRQQHEQLAGARPAVALLDRLVAAQVLAARAGSDDRAATRAFAAAQREVLAAADVLSARASRYAFAARARAIADLARSVAVQLPLRPGPTTKEAFHAFDALTDSATHVVGRVGGGAGLVLDSEPGLHALTELAIVQLPELIDVSGRAVTVGLEAGHSPGHLAAETGALTTSLENISRVSRQDTPLDRSSASALRQPFQAVLSDGRSLTRRLAGYSGEDRWAGTPSAAYDLWLDVATRLDDRLRARQAELERGRLLVALAAGVLLLLAALMLTVLNRSRHRLGVQDSLLHESRAKYKALVEQLPAVTYILDAEKIRTGEGHPLVYVSPQVAALSGYSAEEWLTDDSLWLRLLHPEDRATAFEQAMRIAAGSERRSAEYRIVARDGREVWIRDEAAAVTGDDGSAHAVQGVWLDITDRRRAEDERDRMEADLQVASKLEAVGQLAAGVAHEINTPIQFVGDSMRFLNDSFDDLLALIAEYRVQLARADGAVDGRRIAAAEDHADLEYLQQRVPAAFERTFDGVDRVTTIVQAMKSFSHNAGVEKAPADLNEAIRTTLVVCRNEYKYVADVDLQLGELPPVVCHIGDLNQVVLNLVVNAAHAIEDANGDGGERGVITVRTACEGDAAVIAVADTGCGIPSAVRERIFDPFFTTKDVGRGSGQGLALARSIVIDKHGGVIDVATEPGAGTTFTIRVPIDVKVPAGVG